MNLDQYNATPLYIQLAEKMKEDIHAGKYREGERLPPEANLAEHLKLSRITVRNAFRKLENEGYLQRLRSKGTFIHCPEPEDSRIVIVSDMIPEDNINMHSMFAGMLMRVQCTNIHLEFCSPVQLKNRLEQFPQSGKRIGLLFMLYFCDDKELFQLADKMRFPMLSVTNHHPQNASTLKIENRSAMEEIVRHLYELGHRKIAYINRISDWNTDYPERLDAVRNKLAEYQIFNQELFLDWNESFQKENQDAFFDEIVHRKPTAVICHGDQCAMELSRFLLEKGIRIPEDISITGFDDSYSARNAYPPLTTVRLNYFRFGSLAAERLSRFMNDYTNRVIHEEIPLKIIIRQSTGPVPDEQKEI